jgi:hypothetical protein
MEDNRVYTNDDNRVYTKDNKELLSGCKHKFVNLYYRKRFKKTFPEWVKSPFMICSKCLCIHNLKFSYSNYKEEEKKINI